LAEAVAEATGHRLSKSEVDRILRFEDLRPHRVRMWVHSPDLHFEEKARRICELYLCPPAGARLLCIDEKPMQAIEADDPVRHARLRRVSIQYWTLEMATHRGQWERTGLRDTKDNLLALLVHDFGWRLTPAE
jgi:hypothetical protein